MAKRQTDDMERWAVLGAQERLRQLEAEKKLIEEWLKERRGERGFEWGEIKYPFQETSRRKFTEAVKGKRKSRGKMSAEARKRISEAQKARWAKQKAGKKLNRKRE